MVSEEGWVGMEGAKVARLVVQAVVETMARVALASLSAG